MPVVQEFDPPMVYSYVVTLDQPKFGYCLVTG